jgi:predicted AlkP superfamily phosphohydrolase/phosphomutase
VFVSARVLIIGLDAAEATLIESWAAEGRLPTFARLASEGATVRLANSLETLPGAIWPELTSGRSCGRFPHYYHPRQLHTGETELRPIEPDEIDPGNYYWSEASNAGLRVAVVDQPQTVLTPGLNGIRLLEWGLHDRNFNIQSDPPELYEELRRRYGDHPVWSCDSHANSHAGYERLLAGLIEGAGKKTELLVDLLERESWDLFVCAFGETHCVGHQFWHFFDPSQRGHDPSAPAHLKSAIETVYRRVDAGIGALLASAGPDTTVLVFASHGMGPYVGGTQLLPEVLVRLGLGSGGGAAAQMRSRLPKGLRSAIRRVVPGGARRRLQAKAGSLPKPLQSPLTRAVALPNNRCGAIRLNLKGREPFGSVEPGPEADALVAELRHELHALEDPVSGEPVVDRVITAEEAFGPDHHPDVPDVMVVFNGKIRPIEACRSSRVGVVREEIYDPNIPRSGDHTTESRLWILGPGAEAGGQVTGGNVLDLAPTVLELLDVPLPADLDGSPLLERAARS